MSNFVDILLEISLNYAVKEMVLVSACLLGLKCCYNGCDNTNDDVVDMRELFTLIPVCPEQLAGFSTPRFPAFFTQGDGSDTITGKDNIINEQGTNVSEQFRCGAREVLKLCNLLNIHSAILKEKSPSCGTKQIYVKEKLTKGSGVTATLLKLNGIRVMSENELKEIR